jgi:hypothetical protein
MQKLQIKTVKKCLFSSLMGSKWQKHFVRKWISDQAEAHSQMLILASRFLWFHFVQLIEKKKSITTKY